MSYATLSQSIPWPEYAGDDAKNGLWSALSAMGTMDATGEKLAMVGTVFWADRSTSAKTFGTSSKITIRTNNVTFADASTNLRVGIQDVATSGTVFAQPDGTFDVYADIGGTSGLLTSSDDGVAKSFTMTTGSKSITQGDLIAIVFDMTARGGSDSVQISGFSGRNYNYPMPPLNLENTGSWAQVATYCVPNVLLEADDGTLGVFRGGQFYLSASTNWTFSDSTNPDERGLLFRVPFGCKIDSIRFMTGANDANADFTITLYSDPTGTPAAVVSRSWLGEHMAGNAGPRYLQVQFPDQYALSANTDYVLAIRATGSGNVSLGYYTLANALHRNVNGCANCAYAYRDGGSGAFNVSGTSTIPEMAILISAIETGGLLTHPGMGGGARG
jgi:hypothetical protein